LQDIELAAISLRVGPDNSGNGQSESAVGPRHIGSRVRMRRKMLAMSQTQLAFRGVAKALSVRGIKTARGGEWTAVQVSDILERLGDRPFEVGAAAVQ
jgi:hypothetical protein